jgi:hypothetical protein
MRLGHLVDQVGGYPIDIASGSTVSKYLANIASSVLLKI